MPADIVSFWLKPAGFFDRNPSLDVPPDPDACAADADPGEHTHVHGRNDRAL
jgi:primary-amine oxidase